MTTMRERVARAISAEEAILPEYDHPFSWMDHLPKADVALGALAEPTPEMLKAGIMALIASTEPQAKGQVRGEQVMFVWRAMIKAASAEEENGL